MLTLAAISMTAVMGFTSMGLDIAMWYSEKRATQNIADAAAIAATYARQEGGDEAEMLAAALAEAIRNGYIETAGNDLTVASSTPPATPGVAMPLADVVVTRSVPLFLAGAFLDSDPSVSARATGGYYTLGNICVLGLDPDDGRTIEFVGAAFANIGCGVASNSSSHDALYVGGSATLYANPAQAYGDILVSGSGVLVNQQPPILLTSRVPDPFAFRALTQALDPAPCDEPAGLTVSGSLTIAPVLLNGSFRICGGLTVQPSASLTLDPGTYYIDGGDVLFQGTVTGVGVTIVLTGSTAGDVGRIDIRAQADVVLSAPATGDFAGIAVFQVDFADESGDNKFNGGASLSIDGAIYFPNQQVTFNGGSDLDIEGCTVIIARIVKFTQETYIRNTATVCDSVGLGGSAIAAQRQVVLLQ